jgi:hypothetical protein
MSKNRQLVDAFFDLKTALQKKETRSLKDHDAKMAQCIELWFEVRKNQQEKSKCVDTFVISLGSFGSQEQQRPSFCGDRKNIAVLNVDTEFKLDEKWYLSAMQPSTQIPCWLSKEHYPECYKAISKSIKNELKSGNKVVIINNTYAAGYRDCLEIINDNIEDLGKNLTYVQAYFDFCVAAILNKKFFDLLKTPEGKEWAEKNIIDVLFKGVCKEDGFSLTGMAFKDNKMVPLPKTSPEELEKIVKEKDIGEYGSFHPTLADVPVEKAILKSHVAALGNRDGAHR